MSKSKREFCVLTLLTYMTGGNVVHVAAGFSGLVCSFVVGQRVNYGRENFHPHNILISVLGAALLWVGWMGFNGSRPPPPPPKKNNLTLPPPPHFLTPPAHSKIQARVSMWTFHS
jgi:hypothetical protein